MFKEEKSLSFCNYILIFGQKWFDHSKSFHDEQFLWTSDYFSKGLFMWKCERMMKWCRIWTHQWNDAMEVAWQQVGKLPKGLKNSVRSKLETTLYINFIRMKMHIIVFFFCFLSSKLSWMYPTFLKIQVKEAMKFLLGKHFTLSGQTLKR